MRPASAFATSTLRFALATRQGHSHAGAYSLVSRGAVQAVPGPRVIYGLSWGVDRPAASGYRPAKTDPVSGG